MKQLKNIQYFIVLLLIFIVFDYFVFPETDKKEKSKSETTSPILKEKKKKNNTFLIIPIISYTPETRFGGGVAAGIYLWPKQATEKTRPSSMETLHQYTQNKQLYSYLGANFYLKDELFHILAVFEYKNWPNYFYGTGDNTLKENREIYTPIMKRFSLDIEKKIKPSIYFGFRYRFVHHKIIESEKNGYFSTGSIKGSEKGISSGLGLSLVLDTRDNIFSPYKGRFYEFSLTAYNRLFGSDYSFTTFTIDIRNYWKVFSSHVIAAQLYVNSIMGEPPFYKLSLLGGQYLLRGYYLGRFRDKNLVAFQIEYRFPIMKRFRFVTFAGIGNVAERIFNLGLKQIKYSVGIGIRYSLSKKDRICARLDYGVGKDMTGVYFGINEAY